VWRELQLSAKWTAILFVPALLAAFILSALAGGIEGDGKALLGLRCFGLLYTFQRRTTFRRSPG
jgi:hypothetical protein